MVLVIDDDPDFAAEVADSLRALHFHARVSAGELTKALLDGVDGVMLDLELSGTDGFALLEELARSRADVPVLLVSGHGEDMLRSAVAFALSQGVRTVSTAAKPITVATIDAWARDRVRVRHRDAGAAGSDAAAVGPGTGDVACKPERVQGYFQPKFRSTDLRCIGAEVLARYADPALGMVPPGRFLPRLFEAGLGDRLFDVMLTHACTMLSRLAGTLDGEFTIAINLSPDLFREKSAWLLQRLAEPGLPRERLLLEIPESLTCRPDQRDLRVMASLRFLGYRLSIDDFGREYANVDRLLSFPVSEVKIDRSILDVALRCTAGSDFLERLVEMCASLGLQVVFEGVSSVALLRMTRHFGIGSLQGNLLGQALPAHAFAALMHEALAFR